MKKIYKYFSDLKIDPKINPMQVEENEKESVKNFVLQKKKKSYLIRNLVAAAAIFSLSTISLGVAFPATASQLPVIGNLFTLFQEESSVIGDYTDVATTIGETKESNGVEVTLTDAVYDGESVAITYTMKSDKDLGEHPFLDGEFSIKEYNDDGFRYMPGRMITEKVNDNEYAGLFISYLMTDPKPEETIHVSWMGEEVVLVEDRSKSIAGNWEFELTMDALEREEIELSNHTMTDQGVTVSIEKMVKTPVSNLFYLNHVADKRLMEQWEFVSLDFEITDDLGNEYDVLPNAGYGDHAGSMAWRIMTTVFDENATSITVTPIVSVTNDPEEQIETFTLGSIDVSLSN